MIGEGWTVLAGRGPKFQNQNKPAVVFQVGKPGDVGIMEISDIIFSTIGPGKFSPLAATDNILIDCSRRRDRRSVEHPRAQRSKGGCRHVGHPHSNCWRCEIVDFPGFQI